MRATTMSPLVTTSLVLPGMLVVILRRAAVRLVPAAEFAHGAEGG